MGEAFTTPAAVDLSITDDRIVNGGEHFQFYAHQKNPDGTYKHNIGKHENTIPTGDLKDAPTKAELAPDGAELVMIQHESSTDVFVTVHKPDATWLVPVNPFLRSEPENWTKTGLLRIGRNSPTYNPRDAKGNVGDVSVTITEEIPFNYDNRTVTGQILKVDGKGSPVAVVSPRAENIDNPKDVSPFRQYKITDAQLVNASTRAEQWASGWIDQLSHNVNTLVPPVDQRAFNSPLEPCVVAFPNVTATDANRDRYASDLAKAN